MSWVSCTFAERRLASRRYSSSGKECTVHDGRRLECLTLRRCLWLWIAGAQWRRGVLEYRSIVVSPLLLLGMRGIAESRICVTGLRLGEGVRYGNREYE